MSQKPRRAAAAILARWRPIAAIMAAILAVNVLVQVLVVRRLASMSGGREAILAERRKHLAKTQESVEGLERAASKLACVRSDVAHVMDTVLSSKQERMTSILREVRRLAHDNRMDPERIQYGWSAVGQTGLVQFTISFPLEGPYETLRLFIKQVESSQDFLIIQDVALTGDKAQGSNLKLQVRLVTYFLAPDIDLLKQAFPTVEPKA